MNGVGWSRTVEEGFFGWTEEEDFLCFCSSPFLSPTGGCPCLPSSSSCNLVAPCHLLPLPPSSFRLLPRFPLSSGPSPVPALLRPSFQQPRRLLGQHPRPSPHLLLTVIPAPSVFLPSIQAVVVPGALLEKATWGGGG